LSERRGGGTGEKKDSGEEAGHKKMGAGLTSSIASSLRIGSRNSMFFDRSRTALLPHGRSLCAERIGEEGRAP
jgi:hypothetical protein